MICYQINSCQGMYVEGYRLIYLKDSLNIT